jgi:WD40 repeat protein
MLELSTYHNIFVTSTFNNVIYVWDYEKGLLLGKITLGENVEPTCFEFINGFSILLIGTNDGSIYFLHFSIKNH